MKNPGFLFALAGAALLAGLFAWFKPNPPPAPALRAASAQINPAPQLAAPQIQAHVFELVVKNRKLASGPETLKVNQGDEVSILITSDQAEELHLHGYNLAVDLEANKPATLKLVADRSGRFDYELEKSRIELGSLEVQPR